jgi:hypothetical protein
MEYPTADDVESLQDKPANSSKYDCLLSEVLDEQSECADETVGSVDEVHGHFALFTFDSMDAAFIILRTDSDGFVGIYSGGEGNGAVEWSEVCAMCDMVEDDG